MILKHHSNESFTEDMLICLTEEKLTRMTFILNDQAITIQKLSSPSN